MKSVPCHFGIILEDKFTFGSYSWKHISDSSSYNITETFDDVFRLILEESETIKPLNAFIKSFQGYSFQQDIELLPSSIKI
jgi:hypothetical protein